jgi:ABC-2 type transport system permease protein
VPPGSLARARANATRDVTERLATGFVVLDSTTLRGDSVYYAGRRADSRSELTRIGDGVRAGLIALELQRRGVAAAAIDSVIATPAPALRTETINDAGRSSASLAKSLLAGIVAFFLYASIILYGQSMLSGVIEEKMSRVAEIVISSVSPDILLAGKVIGVTAVGLTQQIIWVVGSMLMVAARGYLFPGVSSAAAAANGGLNSGAFIDAAIALPWSWVVAVLLFFVLGFLFYGALYAAVGATVGSEQDARQAAQPVVLLLVLTAVFISPILQNPGSKLARTMSLLPFSSPIIMPLRMATVDVPPLEVAASIVILALGCAGAIWLAARIYRVGLLMYGKRPSLVELRRWIAAG